MPYVSFALGRFSKGVIDSRLLPLVGAALAFIVIRLSNDLVAKQLPTLVFVWLVPVACAGAAMMRVRVADLAAPPRVFARAGAVFLAFYMAIEPFAIPYAALPSDHPAVMFHAHARWIAFALAVIGWWRIGGIFTAAMLLWMMRELHPVLTGFYFSTLDIRTATESLTFFALGIAMIKGVSARAAAKGGLPLSPDMQARAAMFVLAAVIGGHLGNYLYSGLAKLVLDGGVLSWVFDNRLYSGIPGALEKGTMATASVPALTQALHDAMAVLWLPMNVLSLALQLFAPVALHRRRWLILTTIGYDIFHIAVYFALGLFFWKWIALNTIIVLTLVRMTDRDWDVHLRRCCLVFMLGGPILFRVATLAWYDAPSFASPFFEAVLQDGRRVRVPNAWFLSSSYQVSHGRMFWPSAEQGGARHFNPSVWGSVLDHDDLLASRECRLPTTRTEPDPSYGTLPNLANFVRLQHGIMKERTLDYRLLPHHHMPSPFLAEPFDQVRPEQVVRYDYVLESVCLSLDKGHLKRRVLRRDAWPLYEPQSGKVLQ